MAPPPSPSLDLVSPLPPVPSGIADWAADMLEPLAGRSDLRLVRLPGQPVDPAIVARWRPVEAALLGASERLPLYQMGNNRHHEGVQALAMNQPGVLHLHDLVLHHLLGELTLARGDWDGYEGRLAADHGWIGAAAARPARWGGASLAARFALPARRTLLRRQRGVLVHSRWAAGELAAEDPALRVAVVPMGVPLPAPVGAAAAGELRRRLGVPADALLLGSVGFQTPIKRTEVAIRALALPGLAAVHLLVVGEESPDLGLEEIARAVGVAERVHRLGFLPFEGFQAAIASCDLCLNLRYPSAGETSASLLRVLALGRPAVVSEHGQFAELSYPGVLPLPVAEPTEEGEALAVLLSPFLADRGPLRSMGQAARREVARLHAPEAAADAIVEACRGWAQAPPLGDAPAVAPQPTSLTWRAMAAQITVHGAEEPWDDGERRRLDIVLANPGPARWLAAGREGGVVVEVVFRRPDGKPAGRSRWLEVRCPVAPGERYELEVTVRRPVGPVRLAIEPHVVGAAAFSALGGSAWQAEV